MLEKAIESLCETACPSIRYRIHKEILGASKNSSHMIQLQQEILGDEKVQEIMAWEKEGGWLGDKFHSGCGPETGIRILMEKGVEGDHPLILRALDALKKNEAFDAGCLEKVGKILDQGNFGGSKLIRAVVFSYGGKEEEALVKDGIEKALEAFRYLLSVKEIDDVFETYQGKLVFKKDVQWPSIYHLRLLAYTKGWRSEENLSMMIEAVKQLVKFSPIPDIKVRFRSQIVAPASAFMEHFNQKLDQLEPKEWMLWFHRLEMLARVGVVQAVPQLKAQVEALKQLLLEHNGFFTLKLSHYYFHKWNMYIGLALEKDWKTPSSRINDLTFRSLLILYYAGLLDYD